MMDLLGTPTKYIRILHLVRDTSAGGQMGCRTDTYVLEHGMSLDKITKDLLRYGFERTPDEFGRGYDPETRIMPGAILAITPCDSRGYSEFDRKRPRL